MRDLSESDTSRQAPARRMHRHEHLLALMLFIILTVVMTYPLAIPATDTVVNYGDPLLNTWIIAWDVHALTTDPLHLFDANNFYPYRNTLAYSENLLTTALLAAPFIWLTANPVLAHNLLVLLSFVLAGFSTCLLVRRLTSSLIGGIVGGIVFAFAHYRFGQISHIQMLTSWWIPLTIYFLQRFFDGRKTWDILLFAGCFTAQVWASIYLGIFLAGAVALYLLHALITRRALLSARSMWVHLGISVLLISLAVSPLYFPYSQASDRVGIRGLESQKGATLKNYLSAYPTTLPGHFSALAPTQEPPEHTFFPGFLTLTLAIWAILKRRRKDWRPMSFYLLLIVVSMILSFGPQLEITREQPPLLEGLPYEILYQHIPFLKAIRVPARLGTLVMLGLAVLAGFGITALTSAFKQHRWLLYGLIAIGFAADYLAIPIQLKHIEVGSQVPKVYRWLARQPHQTVIFEFPTAASKDITGDEDSIPRLSRHQYFSAYHWHRTVMGYSGFYPPLFWRSLDYGLHFPSHETIAYLRGLGVRYVLVHKNELTHAEWTHTRLGLERRSEMVSRAMRYGDTLVYQLRKPSPTQPEIELYLPPVSGSDHPYVAYAIAQLPPEQAWVSPERLSYELKVEWQPRTGAGASSEVSGPLPLVLDGGVNVLPLSFPLPTNLPAKLHVRLQTPLQTIEKTQMVELDQAAGQEAIRSAVGENFLRLNAQFSDDPTLAYAHFRQGMDFVAGDPLSLTLYWQWANSTTQPPRAVYVHVLDQQEQKVSQSDTPLPVGKLSTQHMIPLAWDLPPGNYRVIVGVYDKKTLDDIGSPIHISNIQVKQPDDLAGVPENTQTAQLGKSIKFLGYDLIPKTVQAGESVEVILYWRSLTRIAEDCKVFTHLLSSDGTILSQQDNQPRVGRRPTSQWLPEEIVVDRYYLKVPSDTPPGFYPIKVGMYSPDSDQRLPVHGETKGSPSRNYLALKKLEVTP